MTSLAQEEVGADLVGTEMPQSQHVQLPMVHDEVDTELPNAAGVHATLVAQMISDIAELRRTMLGQFKAQSDELQQLYALVLSQQPRSTGSLRRLRSRSLSSSENSLVGEQVAPLPNRSHSRRGLPAAGLHGLEEAVQRRLLARAAVIPEDTVLVHQDEPSQPEHELNHISIVPAPETRTSGPPTASPGPPTASPVEQGARSPPHQAASTVGQEYPQDGAGPVEASTVKPEANVRRAASDGAALKNSRSRVAWALDVKSQNNQVVGKGSLDTLRRRVEEEIIKRSPTQAALGSAADQADHVPRARIQTLITLVDKTSLIALKVAGVLPWRPSCFRASLLYQWTVLMLHVGILAGFLARAHFGFSSGTPFLMGDLVLALGSVAGLVAAGSATGSCKLLSILERLEDSNRLETFEGSVRAGNATDSLVTLGVWVLFLSNRLGTLAASKGLSDMTWVDILHYVGLVLSSAEVAILSLVVLRLARNMLGLVDAFCTSFYKSQVIADSVERWNVLQANVRVASSAVERCFAVLLSTMVLEAMAMVFDYGELQGVEWALSAPALLILSMSQILLRASAVTDSCVRVSQLVNSTFSTNDPLDEERMFLVEFITASAAGFHVFDVRLCAGLAMKIFHYTGLMAFTVARALPTSGSL